MDKTGTFGCVSRRVYESPRMNLYSVEAECFLASSLGTGGDAGGIGNDFPWATDERDANVLPDDSWGGY